MCERNSGGDRRAGDLSRSTLGRNLPPRSSLASPSPGRSLGQTQPRDHRRLAHPQDPRVAHGRKSPLPPKPQPTGRRPSPPTLAIPQPDPASVQPSPTTLRPHAFTSSSHGLLSSVLDQSQSPLLCISSSPTELSLYLTQPGTPVSHPAQGLSASAAAKGPPWI